MRHRLGRSLLVVAAAAALLTGPGVVLAASPPDVTTIPTGTTTTPTGTTPTTPPTLQPVVLPGDHGAHPGFQIEWWYTAGTVSARSGHDYFWFATVWSSMGGLVGRVNVVDLRTDRVVLSKEYVAAGTPASGQTQMNIDGFALGWQASSALGTWSVAAPVPGVGALRLTLSPVQPYVLNGSQGIVPEGPGASSAYYSAPRLAAHGTLVLGSRTIRVSGQGWLDHQWGNFATNAASWHWNWFACQFRDGRDLMLYQFIKPSSRPTGVQTGTFVPRPGVSDPLQRFTIQPLGKKIHPPGATASYPLDWRLKVPAARLDLTLAARARHQFIPNQYVPGFWEGAATVTSGPPGECIVESTREPLSTP